MTIKAKLVFDPTFDSPGKWKQGDTAYVEAENYDDLRWRIGLMYFGFVCSLDWIHVFVDDKQVATVQLVDSKRHIWWPIGERMKDYDPYTGKITRSD